MSESASPTPDRVAEAVAGTTKLIEEIQAQFPAFAYSPLPRVYAEQLQTCIHEYVAVLRAIGTTPERTLKEVKSLIARATTGRDVYPNHLLMNVAVMWAIEEYYR